MDPGIGARLADSRTNHRNSGADCTLRGPGPAPAAKGHAAKGDNALGGCSGPGEGLTKAGRRELAGDPRKYLFVDLAGLLQLQEMACIVDHRHARSGRKEVFGAPGQLHANAAVRRSVEVESGLRSLPADGELLVRVTSRCPA